MSKCKQCQVEILDESRVCPLCRCVIDYAGENENMYPQIVKKERVLKLIIRIFLFVAIVAEGILIYLNQKYFQGIWWSAITGGGLFLIYIGMKDLMEYEFGYRSKAFTMICCGMLYVFLIDYVLGFHGWSLNIVLPIVIMGMDAGILVLMIVNIRNWQSYMMLQMLTIVLALLTILLWRLGFITNPSLSELSLAVAAVFFLGTLIIGGGRAVTELYRRFHIR